MELLSASLIGTALGVEGGASSEAGGMRRGLLFVAFDPTAHTAASLESAERLFAAVRAAGGRLPADARYAARADAAEPEQGASSGEGVAAGGGAGGAGAGVLVQPELLEECGFGGLLPTRVP